MVAPLELLPVVLMDAPDAQRLVAPMVAPPGVARFAIDELEHQFISKRRSRAAF